MTSVDMVSRAPYATADEVTPSATACTNAHLDREIQRKSSISSFCRLQADGNDPYKSEAYYLTSGSTEQRISRIRTTEFAQSSGTEKQRVALSILG